MPAIYAQPGTLYKKHGLNALVGMTPFGMLCILLFFIVIHINNAGMKRWLILTRPCQPMYWAGLLTELSTGLSKPCGINHCNRFQHLFKGLQ